MGKEAMTQGVIPNLDNHDVTLSIFCEAGYTIGLNVRNVTPQVYHSTYDPEWLNEYLTGAYILDDPVIGWALQNTGSERWSSILTNWGDDIPPKSLAVMERAALVGLKFGVVVVRLRDEATNSRSFFLAARSDREFEDKELEAIERVFDQIILAFENKGILNKFEIEVLELAAMGLSMKQTADRIGMSLDTVKKRLESARRTLGASTTVHAVSLAQGRNIITGSGSAKW